MLQLKNLPLEGQTRVMFLHNVAFGGDSACKSCAGECCKHCSSNKGYLRDNMNDREWAQFARKHNFSTKDGFKGSDGCVLPITERSNTCLTFMCPGTQTSYGYGPPKDKPFEEYRQQAVEDMMDIFIEARHGTTKVQWPEAVNEPWPFPGR